MMLKKFFQVSCLFFLFQGCTSLVVNLPNARLESPESTGKLFRTEIATGVSSSHEVTITPDAASRPPNTSQSSVDSDVAIPFFVTMGLTSHIDAELRTNLLTNELLFKAQLLGESVRNAHESNFSLAVTAGVESGGSSSSGTQATLFGPGNAAWNAQVKFIATDYAMIAGYRLNDFVLFYGGPFIMLYNSNSTIHQDAVSSPSSPAADYSLTQKGQNFGGNFATKFNFSPEKMWSVTGEVEYSSFQWSNAPNFNDLRWSVFGAVLF